MPDTKTPELGLPADQIAAVRKPLAEASLLPAAIYTDRAIFEREGATAFARQWLPVCHVSQLPEPGCYVGRVVGSEPVLVVRDKSGELRAYSNVCRHRNTTLVMGEGRFKGNRFSCPYHGWTYNIEGRLLAAPFMDQTAGFERDANNLPPIRLEVWQGFVFVNLDADAAPLGPQLAGLDKLVAEYDFATKTAVPMTSAEADWNWKVSLENFSEAYHQPWVHPQTAEASAPALGARYYSNGGGGAPWSAFLIPHSQEIEAFAMAAAKEADGPIAADAPPTSIDEGALVFNIYPYFHVLATPHATLWLDFEDIAGPERHTLRWRLLFTTEALAEGADKAVAEVNAFLKPVIAEDVDICSRVRSGVKARLVRPGRLSHMERAVHEFHNWWLDTLGA